MTFYINIEDDYRYEKKNKKKKKKIMKKRFL